MKKQIQLNEELIDVEIKDHGPKFVLFSMDGVEYAVNLAADYDGVMTLNQNGSNHKITSVETHFVVVLSSISKPLSVDEINQKVKATIKWFLQCLEKF